MRAWLRSGIASARWAISHVRLRGRSALLVVTLVAIATNVAATPASADCGIAGPPPSISGYRGIAFIGRVIANDPTSLRYRPSGSRSDQIRLAFRVERPIEGITDDRVVVIGGEKGNCSVFWASELTVGDRVLISFRPPRDEDEFELEDAAHLVWYALVWRPTDDGGWRFARGAVQFPGAHPVSAQAADSLSEILALVGPGLPPTDMTPATPRHQLPSERPLLPAMEPMILVLVGLAGAARTIRRIRQPVADRS